MGKKSSAATPPPPDPAATAAAQASLNNASADYNAKLNRIDTTTPFGSQTYNYKPPAQTTTTNPDGTTTSAADPNDPGTWSQNITLAPDQQKLLDTQTGVTQQAYDLAASQFPRVSSTLNSTFNPTGVAMAGPISANGGPITTNVPGAGAGIANTYGSGGDVQSGLDFSGAPSLVSGDALKGYGEDVSNSIYNQATRNLDPRFQQEEQSVSNGLVNRGIPVGSAAFNTAMSNYRQSRDNAYADAQDRATQGGVSAANTLFGEGLAARQQSVGETTASGQFKNQAQQLAESEAAARAGFTNTAQAQAYEQAVQNAAFGNTAQQQNWAQQFALAGQNASLQNTQAQTDYERQLQARELPLQEVSGLLGTGPGVQPLNFAGTPTVSTAAPDYTGAVNTAYQGQLSAANNQNQTNASQTGSTVATIGTIAAIAF